MRLKPLPALYSAQFLSAFADNMILFITLEIIRIRHFPEFYLPLVQGSFLLSYLILAPWVGRIADKHPKARILIWGNTLKALGILLLFLGVDPALSYAVAGVGAVVYSPAKYGILPDLTDSEGDLLKANSRIESFTILAILTGAAGGGTLAAHSVPLALLASGLLYGLSILFVFWIPSLPGNPAITYSRAIRELFADLRTLFSLPASRFSLVGTGAFWMATAVMRLIVVAWIPLTLGIASTDHISYIVALTGIGIVLGAFAAPKLIGPGHYRQTRWYGLGLLTAILAFTFIGDLYSTIVALLAVGFFGGVFIVPMNTVLQEDGHRTIGAGKTIAIQNLVENTLMLTGVALYTAASKAHVPLDLSIAATGAAMALFVAYLFLEARQDEGASHSGPGDEVAG